MEIFRLKSQAEAAARLQKQLLQAETRAAEKQAELDRNQRQLASVVQLLKELMFQKQNSSNMQLELARVRSENDGIKLQLLRFDALKRELERQKKAAEDEKLKVEILKKSLHIFMQPPE